MITVNAPPPASPQLSSGVNPLCSGQSTTLTASGSGTINWFNSGGTNLGSGTTLSINSAGTYYASASNGCGTSAQTGIVINGSSIQSAPTLNLSGSQSICPGSSITLSAVTGTGITWNTGSTNSSISVNTAGTYYATATNSCGTSGNSAVVSVSLIAAPVVNPISGSTTLCPGSNVTLYDATGGGSWSGGDGSIATINGSGVVTAIAQGSTTVYYSVTNGCGQTTTVSAVITVNAPPPASPQLSSGVNPLCVGLSTTLTASGTGLITWYNSSGNILGTGSTISINNADTYHASSSNGCGVSAITYLTISSASVSPAPQITSSIGQTLLCNGISTNLIASGTGTIHWSTGQTGNTISVNTAATYSATVDNGNGCGLSSPGYIAITSASVASAPSITSTSSVICASGSANLTTVSLSIPNINAGITWSTGQNLPVITVTNAGTYTATVDNGSGCGPGLAGNITITPISPPVINPITGDNTVCQNTYLNLVDTASGGIWFSKNNTIATIDPNTGTVLGIAIGVDTIQYQITNACGTAQVNKIITVLIPPVLSPITTIPSNLSTICVGSTGAFTNSTQGGVWVSSNPGIAIINNNGQLSGIAAGNTSISYLVTNSCGVSQQITTITVNAITSNPSLSGYTAKNWVGVGSTLNIGNSISGGVWTSSQPSVAAIDNSGNITGISPGLTQISYSMTSTCSLFTMNLSVSNSASSQSAANIASTLSKAGVIGTITPPSLYTAAAININYIRSRDALFPILDSAAFRIAGNTQVKYNTQYFDGLGRLAETVMRQASPLGNDMVSPVIYDSFGREPYKYLPYTTTATDGNFKKDPFTTQASFMSSQYPGEQVYFGQTVFEPSPLNRVLQTMAPGNSWAGAGRGVTTEYRVNDLNDSIPIWNITNNPLSYANNDSLTNIPYSNSYYAPGQLFETHNIDEQGNRIVEFKDLEGRVVLKKVLIDANASESNHGWLSTYYVYDDFGLLRFVIPPKATANLLNNNWQLSNSVINELCFRYEYDYRNRMIAKKVPGAGWVYMVYDQRDRLVFTQDANMRTNGQWMYTLCDALNRNVQTGMMSGYTGSPADLQIYVNGNTGNSIPSSVTTNGSNAPTVPVTAVYNLSDPSIRSYQASSSIVFTDGFTTGDSTSFVAQIVPAYTSSFSNTVVVIDNPIPTNGVNVIGLTLNYYDDYTQTTKTYNNTNNAKLDIGNNLYGDSVQLVNSHNTRGLATVSRVRVIENPANLAQGSWLETVHYFDNKGRALQVQSDNYKGGLETVTSRYDFTNKPICIYQTHSNPSANTNISVKTNMDYDFGSRLLAMRKVINDDSTTKRTLAQNSYNELGQLINKHLGQQKNLDGTLNSSPLENQDFTYNIRGWLKGINWAGYGSSTGTSPVTSTTNNKWFAMDLGYDWGYQNNQYNGNISGQRWQSAGDGAERSFGYGYDNANRLLFADFKQNFGNGGSPQWTNTASDNFNIDFSLKMGNGMDYRTAYDENGNILDLWQKGLLLNTSATIDSLGYTYYSNSNKLQNVIDANNNPNTVLGDFRSSANYLSSLGGTKTIASIDYNYDANGNLLKDLNKDIGTGSSGGIVYNHLNLPYQVTVYSPSVAGGIKGTIMYIYDAAGNKLEKRTLDSTAKKTTYTTYIDGFVYGDNALQFFAHEEGRVRYTAATTPTKSPVFNYDYFIKDHLGNVRMVLTDEQQQDTYPAATLEDGATQVESNYYTINPSDIVTNPPSLPNTYQNNNGNPPFNNNPSSNPTATSQKMYRLNGATGDKTGLGITLRVMSGDNVNIFGKSLWHSNGTQINNNNSLPALDLLGALAGTTVLKNLGHDVTNAITTGGSSVTPGDVTNLLNNVPVPSNKPKAYINWILFDDQFRPVTTSGGFDAVSDNPDQLKAHAQSVPVTKNGYLYVYASNESNQDVFFDNLQVTHTRGPLLEENHYYPFGLAMSGISSKAAGKLENKKNKFQGQEYNDDLGIDMYEFKYRMDDPQTGRFWQVDPLADKYVHNSTYAFSENKVTSHVELEGLEAVEVSTVTQTMNGKTTILHSDRKEVDNPNKLGSGTLYNLTSIGYDNDGNQTIRTTHLYEGTFMQKLLNGFSFGQIQVYGSGDGSDGIGSKPDYSKPITSINMADIAPLLDLMVNGGAKPSYKTPKGDDVADFAKDLFNRVDDATSAAKSNGSDKDRRSAGPPTLIGISGKRGSTDFIRVDEQGKTIDTIRIGFDDKKKSKIDTIKNDNYKQK